MAQLSHNTKEIEAKNLCGIGDKCIKFIENGKYFN